MLHAKDMRFISFESQDPRRKVQDCIYICCRHRLCKSHLIMLPERLWSCGEQHVVRFDTMLATSEAKG